MSLRAWLDPRNSFRSKLIYALLGTVGALVAVALLVVRAETAQQVRAVTERAVAQSEIAFAEAEDFQRFQLSSLASAFTESIRRFAQIEAAIEERAVTGALSAETDSFLVNDVLYEIQARQIPQSLVALTDAAGEPFVLLVNDGRAESPSLAAQIRRAAWPALAPASSDAGSAEPELFGYALIQDALYATEAIPITDDYGDVRGGVVLALPLDTTLAGRLGRLSGAGTAVCFVIDGRCAVSNVDDTSAVAAAMIARAGRADDAMPGIDGARWSVVSEPLVASRPQDGHRVLAIPLEPWLRPFDRITRALLLGGAAALVLAVAVSVFLSRGLAKPVHALVRATTAVAHGDYDTRVDVASRDEMGRLATAFNEMTHGLLLKEQYRGVLDKVVSPEIANELLKGEVVLGGENREVTTLFADITGFTAITEGMEPQAVITLINECMERLGRVIEERGGVVDKYVGDQVMALFGAPVEQPDHAARAIAAALRMNDEMADLNRQRVARGEPELHVATGIHSGVVVAGNMGSPNRLNYTVLGAGVNLAARLCSLAGAGDVLVSDATHHAVRDAVRATSLGTKPLKGFSNPIQVWRVDALVSPEEESPGLRAAHA
ncbi:MAG TPA: adenylate/guanylate cyclase domain-containing protein [Longimicrobiales bacterium]